MEARRHGYSRNPEGNTVELVCKRNFTMSLYRVTMTINLDVKITEDNADVDPRPALQGDNPQSALNRATCMWLEGMSRAERQALGLGRSVLFKKDMHVIQIEPEEQTA